MVETLLIQWIGRSDVYTLLAAIFGAITAVSTVYISEHLKKKTEQKVLIRPILSKHTFNSHLYFEDEGYEHPLYKSKLSDEFNEMDIKFVNYGDAIYNVRYELKLKDVSRLVAFIEENAPSYNLYEHEFKLVSASVELDYDYIGSDGYIGIDNSEHPVLVIDELVPDRENITHVVNIHSEHMGYESYIPRNEIYSVKISKGYYLLIQLLIERILKLENQSGYLNLFQLEIKYEDIKGNTYDNYYPYSLNIYNTIFDYTNNLINTKLVLFSE